MPSASSGDSTWNSIGRVASRASVSMAIVRDRANSTHRCQSGRHASVAFISMKVAKASLSQMPFHHFIVTRFPNHMCAVSWLMTSVRLRSSGVVAAVGSMSRSTSR